MKDKLHNADKRPKNLASSLSKCFIR